MASLADLLGAERTVAVCHARAALTGEETEQLLTLARRPVDFLPETFLARQHRLLAQVGRPVVAPSASPPSRGATTRKFEAATSLAQSPLSAAGFFRIGEDGRLHLIAKSEHYHVPLGHGFPGYALLERARQLGIPNATHNNTRGHLTRRLEEELVRAVNGLAADDAPGFARLLAADDPWVCNRVLNLETGSLAVEAALKMILTRFHRIAEEAGEPRYAGRIPVFLVIGNDQGGLEANYHGTTTLAQTLRGMWPRLRAGAEEAGLYRIHAIRPNCRADLDDAFARWEGGGHKIAGFLHEIVMMNYGGRLLRAEFLQEAHRLCRAHDVPIVVDEIQSCLWHHELFFFREYGLTPSFVAVGKGFPGGEYPASRLIFSAALDSLPQFGALVTNGQEELAALAYLVTLRWARANAGATRAIGDYYESRLRALAAAHPATIAGVEGRRHLATILFRSLDAAKAFVQELGRRGLDVSAQTYKQDCPPAVLTKIPLISTPEVVDFILEQMGAALPVAG
ncbi:MAG: aminotransferase class III-fold pyridoxal phosphate-dependent enzyme [Planctomycetes bacterium]|nr:aminotransferase class III-fold pyridoxal phosphate-dependent enzyme [Planctomycetota bacterium]